MAAAEHQPTAAPKKKRRLNWSAPASEANPEWTPDRSLRDHVQALLSGGREPNTLAAELGIGVPSMQQCLQRPTKSAAKPARKPKPTAAAPVTGGGTLDTSPPQQPEPAAAVAVALPLPVGRGAGAAGGVGAVPPTAANDDWVAARELVATADADELAEFIAAYDLTDKFDAFQIGFRRGQRRAQPAA